MKTNTKLACSVFSTKETVLVLPILNSGKFSKLNSTITQKILRRPKKNKVLSKNERQV